MSFEINEDIAKQFAANGENSNGAGEGEGNNGEGAGDNNNNGEGAGEGEGSGTANNGEGQGQGEGSGAGEGNNNGEGEGAGEGDGAGQGEGQGSGNGEGEGDDDDIDDERFLRIVAKRTGKSYTAVDDVFKPVVETKEINKYEKISESAQKFLDYHTETGRGFDDYQKLQQDLTAVPDIDFARDRVRKESGMNLTNAEADSYLEKKLQIDLSDLGDMDVADKVELSAFARQTREEALQDQAKYKQPLEQNPANAGNGDNLPDDMVRLESGEIIPKATYDELVIKRQTYLNEVKGAVNKIAVSECSITVDDNGTDKVLTYSYDFSKEDKQNMLSSAENIDAAVGKLFRAENGDFNHNEFAESVWWLDRNNREKAMAVIIHKALAERTEELMKAEGNINLGNKTDLQTQGDGRRTVAIPGTNQGFGIKGNFNQ